MRTAPVVVRGPLAKDSSEVAFVERDQPVETLPTDRPDQALAERVACGVRTGVACRSTGDGITFAESS